MPFLRMHTTYIQMQIYILLATMLTIETMFLLAIKVFYGFSDGRRIPKASVKLL